MVGNPPKVCAKNHFSSNKPFSPVKKPLEIEEMTWKRLFFKTICAPSRENRKSMKLARLLTILPACLLAPAASAAIVVGDYRTEADLPFQGGGSGPLVYESLNQPTVAGYELDDSHFIENPSNWGGGVVFVDYNSATNQITLASQDGWDFETWEFTLSNIQFSSPGLAINGLSLISGNITTNASPSFSFTHNSLSIRYENFEAFEFTGTEAVFQVSVVPEPGSIAALGGLLASGLLLRRRASAAR